jgi:hypothetical protein
MARLVEAVKCAEVISEKFNIPLADLVDVFAEIPTADVKEVQHGYWKIEDDISNKHTQMLVCSVCGRKVFNVVNPSKAIEYRPYCHCGSRMDGTPKERGGEK